MEKLGGSGASRSQIYRGNVAVWLSSSLLAGGFGGIAGSSLYFPESNLWPIAIVFGGLVFSALGALSGGSVGAVFSFIWRGQTVNRLGAGLFSIALGILAFIYAKP